MRPIGKPLAFDPTATSEIVWVPQHEAEALIAKTLTQAGRARDLAVLHAAFTAST